MNIGTRRLSVIAVPLLMLFAVLAATSCSDSETGDPAPESTPLPSEAPETTEPPTTAAPPPTTSGTTTTLPSAEQMREALEAEGLSDDEIDCIEDSFVDDYGSVDDAWDAAQEDARVTLRPLVSCMEVLGVSGEVGECVGDMFVDQYGNGSMGVDEFTEVVEDLGPPDRMALSASSLVCQGLPPDIADCVVDAMDAEYPDMFEPERMEPLTAEQQGFMFAAAEDCGY